MRDATSAPSQHDRRQRPSADKRVGTVRGWRRATAVAAVVIVVLALLAIGHSVLGQPGFLGAAGSGRLVAGAAMLLLLAVTPAAALPQQLLRPYVCILGGSLVLWAGTVTSLSGVLLDALLAAVTGLACYTVGRQVTSRLGLHEAVPWPVQLTVGAGLTSLAVLLLGRLGLISPWTIGLAVLGVPLCLLGPVVRQRNRLRANGSFREALTRSLDALAFDRVTAGAFGCLLVVLGAGVVWASAPEIQYDAVYAKAWLPSQWAASGRIGPSLDHPVLNMTGAAQLLAVPAHTLGAPAVGRFLQLLTAAALAAALWQWGNRTGSAWRGPIAALVVISTPHVLWQAGTAYDDLLLAFFALSAAVASVLLPVSNGVLRSGVLLGLAGGTCVAAKLHLAPFAAVLLAAWLLVQSGSHGRLRGLAGVAAGGAVIALPGPLLSLAATGNPVFPQYNAVFQSQYYPLVNERYNFPYTTGGSLGDLIRLPWQAVVEPSVYVEAVPAGGFGVLVPLLLLAILVGWRLGRRWLPVWAAVVLAMAYWWLNFRYLRYALPMMVVAIAVLAHAGARPLSSRPRKSTRGATASWSVLLGVVVFVTALVPSTLASFWNIPERFPWRVTLGMSAPADYEKVISGTEVLRRFNEVAEPGDVLVGGLYGRTLLSPELDLTPGWELTNVLSADGPLPVDPQALRELARDRGVNWATVGSGGDLSTTFPLISTLVGTFGTPIFAAENQVLYRLGDTPVKSATTRPSPVCDSGFVGDAGCWSTVLDSVPGLSLAEAPGGVSQQIPACPGATYRSRLDATGAGGNVRITLSASGGVARSSLGEATPGGTATAVLTTPDDASSMVVYVVNFGPGVAHRVSLERLDDGPAC